MANDTQAAQGGDALDAAAIGMNSVLHRLSEGNVAGAREVAEYVKQMLALAARAAPSREPSKPAATLRYRRGTPCVIKWNSLPDGDYALYAAPQPSAQVPVYDYTDGTLSLEREVLDAIGVHAKSRPESGDDEESWESWFEAAFDLTTSRVKAVFREMSNRQPSAPAPEVPDDFMSHQAAWRKAIETLAEQDDSGYWPHELRAFDRAYAELAALAQPATQAAEWEKLRDPAVLHANLLRGVPAKLTREQLLHLAGQPEPCSTCNDMGAVGNILTAEPCPDCAPLQPVAQDTERLDWMDADGAERVFHLGPTWYTRASYGQPYRKRANLRAAIDAARAQALAQQGGGHA